MRNISISVVMTVFNRAEKTARCIDSIIRENKDGRYNLSFFITNDGSTDNTEEILEKYQENNQDIKFYVLQGTGNLFWNKGMYLAYGEALKSKPDYYLWVNNDVVFTEGFLANLLVDIDKAKQKNRITLICGSVRSFETNEWSYGGLKNLSKIDPYKREKIIPNGEIQKCDCINGNCLLIPYESAALLGNVDERYEHGFGDFDYGYKLIESGGAAYIASSYVGQCERNTLKGTWNDPSVPFIDRIRKKNRPTGQPYKSHKLFLKKWFPRFWLYYLWRPYVRIAVTSLQYRLKNMRSKS